MITHLILGFLGSYFGGIPFGPINLSVVDTTLRHGRKQAFKFSVAAAVVEIGEAGVAILFGQLIKLELESSLALKILVIVFFVVLGFYFIIKKDDPSLGEEHKGMSQFIRGLIISGLNPQAIPFWIFVLAFFRSNDLIFLEGNNIIYFLTGVSLGKFVILGNFIMLSHYLKDRLKNVCSLVSKTIGGILLLIGLFQAYKFFIMG